MKDYFNNDIHIGDTCIINYFNEFAYGRIIDSDDYQGGRVKIRISEEYECDLTIQLSNNIINITALKTDGTKVSQKVMVLSEDDENNIRSIDRYY